MDDSRHSGKGTRQHEWKVQTNGVGPWIFNPRKMREQERHEVDSEHAPTLAGHNARVARQMSIFSYGCLTTVAV